MKEVEKVVKFYKRKAYVSIISYLFFSLMMFGVGIYFLTKYNAIWYLSVMMFALAILGILLSIVVGRFHLKRLNKLEEELKEKNNNEN